MVSPALKVAGWAVVINLVIWIALVGGPGDFYEVLEPLWQDELVWPPKNAWQLTGEGTDGNRQTVLVTGANRGLGLAVSTQFATLGANVVLVCRSEKSCTAAANEVRAVAAEGATITHVVADFTNLIQVGEVASQLRKKEISIDIAVLNAAVVDPTPILTATGTPRMFVVNYLANIALINDLLRLGVVRPRTAAQTAASVPPPRFVFVSSGSYQLGDPSIFGCESPTWSMLDAVQYYGQSKFELNMYAYHLYEKLGREVEVVVNSPGPILTKLGDEHIPAFLAPSYHAMKALLFPAAMKVAESIAVLSMRKPYNNGVYFHIREDRSHELRDELFDKDLREVQLLKTLKALRKEGYAIAKAHLNDPSLILIREVVEEEEVVEAEPVVPAIDNNKNSKVEEPAPDPHVAYVVAHMEVNGEEGMKEFSTNIGGAVQKHNGRLLIKMDAPITMDGESRGLVTLVEFQHLQSATRFYESEEYQKAAEGATSATSGDEMYSTTISYVTKGASLYPARRDSGYVLMYIRESRDYLYDLRSTETAVWHKAMTGAGDGGDGNNMVTKLVGLTIMVEKAVQAHGGKVLVAPSSDHLKDDDRFPAEAVEAYWTAPRPLDFRQGGSKKIGKAFWFQFKTKQHADDFCASAEWQEVVAATKHAFLDSVDVYVMEGMDADVNTDEGSARHKVIR